MKPANTFNFLNRSNINVTLPQALPSFLKIIFSVDLTQNFKF
jgi:hypothetical protein